MSIWHRIEHWFGWNTGVVESFWLRDELWTGYRCSKCDTINSAQRSVVQ